MEKVEEVNFFKEHNTTSFGALVDKRKQKVLNKDRKLSAKKKQNNKKSNDFDVSEEKVEHNIEDTKVIDTNFVNQGYSSSEYEEDSEEAGVTPRIPEIESLPFAQDHEETVEVEISPEMEMREKNMFIKMTPSLDQDALDLRMQKAECEVRDNNHDSKSMTAVKSFQFDTESESESSDEEEDGRAKTKVSDGKDNFIEEMMKIEKTLPNIERKANDMGKATSITSEDKDKKPKPKKKIMIGQAFKEITRTTEKPLTKKELPPESTEKTAVDKTDSKKSGKSSLVINESSHITSNAKDQSIVDIKKRNIDKIDNHCKVITTPKAEIINQSDKINELSENEEKKIRNKTEVKNDANVKSAVQESEVTAFNIEDSSSDGDEVEMIYQSESSRKAESKRDISKNNDIDLLKGRPDSVGLDIERVAKANDLDNSGKTSVHTAKYQRNESVITELQEYDDNNHTDTMFGVTKVETALDITDIDDVDEDGNEKTFVPSLKLNFNEKQTQKTKRVNKQYSSKMKYLGASVPHKTKRK